MKKAHVKSITGGRRAHRVNKTDLAEGSDFYSHAIPELWDLKLKARQRMGFNDANSLPLAVNQ